MWWWIFFILFFLVSVVSSALLFYALKRLNQYENLITQFQQIIYFSTEKMKEVDVNGHYESDDETGFFFKQLKELQLLLNDVFETEETEDAKSSEAKSSEKEKS